MKKVIYGIVGILTFLVLVMWAYGQQLRPNLPIPGIFLWSQLTSTNAPSDGQFLSWNSTSQTWEPSAGGGSASTNGLASTNSPVSTFTNDAGYVTAGLLASWSYSNCGNISVGSTLITNHGPLRAFFCPITALVSSNAGSSYGWAFTNLTTGYSYIRTGYPLNVGRTNGADMFPMSVGDVGAITNLNTAASFLQVLSGQLIY